MQEINNIKNNNNTLLINSLDDINHQYIADNNIIYIKSDMGTGKTKLIQQYL